MPVANTNNVIAAPEIIFKYFLCLPVAEKRRNDATTSGRPARNIASNGVTRKTRANEKSAPPVISPILSVI
jgi:hypothetical protein